MAITSYGYGPIGANSGAINSPQWAVLEEELGAAYGVAGFLHWKVLPVVGPGRTVSVAAGRGFGRGIYDIADANTNVQLGPIPTSGSRWDLVVARRTWGTTGATTFTFVQGGASAVVPAGRLVGPGVADDQPLALVRLTAGNSDPVEVIDLRRWNSKVQTADDLRALVDAAPYDEAVVRAIRYRYVADGSGSWAWAPNDGDSIRLANNTPQNLNAGVYTAMTWPQTSRSGTADFATVVNGQVTITRDGMYSLSLNVSANVRLGTPEIAAQIITPGGNVHCEGSSTSRLRVSCGSAGTFLAAGTVLQARVFCYADSVTIPADGSLANAWSITRLTN